jgi:C-methyltransferase
LLDAVEDERCSAEDLTASVGADATMVYRLLPALACHDIFAETRPGYFALTPLAGCLWKDSPDGSAAVR